MDYFYDDFQVINQKFLGSRPHYDVKPKKGKGKDNSIGIYNSKHVRKQEKLLSKTR